MCQKQNNNTINKGTFQKRETYPVKKNLRLSVTITNTKGTSSDQKQRTPNSNSNVPEKLKSTTKGKYVITEVSVTCIFLLLPSFK